MHWGGYESSPGEGGLELFPLLDRRVVLPVHSVDICIVLVRPSGQIEPLGLLVLAMNVDPHSVELTFLHGMRILTMLEFLVIELQICTVNAFLVRWTVLDGLELRRAPSAVKVGLRIFGAGVSGGVVGCSRPFVSDVDGVEVVFK
jgi:hypothetical protein